MKEWWLSLGWLTDPGLAGEIRKLHASYPDPRPALSTVVRYLLREGLDAVHQSGPKKLHDSPGRRR